jgi:hypothetical protein
MSTTLVQDRGTSQRFSPSRGYRRLRGGFLPRESQRPELPASDALTELIAPAEERGTVIEPRRKVLKEPDWDVAVLERQRFTEVAACGIDTSRVGTKVAVVMGWVSETGKECNVCTSTHSSPNSAY